MHPILFHLGPASGGITIHTFGALLVVAFATGLMLAAAKAKRTQIVTGIGPDEVMDIAVWAILFGILGARLLFVLIGWNDFKQHPLDVLQIWQGGISFHGGLIGGLGAILFMCRKKHINVLAMADILAPSMMIGYAIGRIGCFFNGCCYGAPTHMPWGVRFYEDGAWTVPSHPTQLYASALSFVFFGVLIGMTRRQTYTGQLACWYLMLSAIERFIMEIWRSGVTSSGTILGLTEVQALCIVMFAIGAAGTVVLPRIGKAPLLARAAGKA